MLDIRPVLYVNGLLLLVLAAAMQLPMTIEFLSGRADWQVFFASSLVTGFAGGGLAVGNQGRRPMSLTTRQAFLLTTLTWVLLAGFSALPFMFSQLSMSFTDGYFEAMAGLTTTASTVIAGLDDAPRGILLWRALLQWLGGIGIIVVAVIILPALRIGGMQMFRMEASEKSDRIKPRISQIAIAICVVYVMLTALCTVALTVAGMTWFEATCHAFTTLSTGGFSTSSASAGHFASPLIDWILVVFMVLGGGTFVLYTTAWRGDRRALTQDSQIRWYLLFLAFFSGLLGFWQWAVNGVGAHDAFRTATFSVVSIVTTTGFTTADYSSWGGFPQIAVFILTFIGGCTGSTSGAVKIFRWEVLFAMARVHLKRLVLPHGVFIIDFNKRRVTDAVMRSVLGFLAMYFITFAVLSLSLTAVGLDLITSISGAATTLGNVGPGLGHLIGPSGSFQPLPDAAKWLLSAGMLLGRLELFTVIVLFLPAFWKD